MNWVLLLCGKYHDQNQPEEERVLQVMLDQEGKPEQEFRQEPEAGI